MIFFGHRRKALVKESLHAVPFVGLGGVDIPFRVARDHVHAVELAGLPTTVAKGRQLFERVTAQDVNELVFAVADI